MELVERLRTDGMDVWIDQHGIEAAIADVLKIKLTAKDIKEIQKKPTDNPEAYEYYLKAAAYIGINGPNVYLYAMQLLDEAIKLDPNFAAAYWSKALACISHYREYARVPLYLDRATWVQCFGECFPIALRFLILQEIVSRRGGELGPQKPT